MSTGQQTADRVCIRAATTADIPAILAMIRELAEFERMLDLVRATEEGLRTHLFGPSRAAESVLACDREGRPLAYAIFFHNFSTFVGAPGLYLEDLYVRPPYRGQGIGKQLLVYLARLAKERGCQRFEWSVLDWNENAIRFYKSLGAKPMDQWTTFRLDSSALDRLAAQSPE